MTSRILIDAAHKEETRVVVQKNQQIFEFDFESENKLPLRGNIYLAKVTRVEPSLQAAFVEYGGNRQGFLAFSEIHPDYYQIPVSDREALLKEHADEQKEDEPDSESAVASDNDDGDDNGEDSARVESVGGDAHEEASSGNRAHSSSRKYKIQEVIKRRQVILIQVVKEERGNKGAALTTYISLAGRYCVLMPNTARGGGISRKINNSADRKKLKTTVEKLGVPAGMGLIIRTAGSQRTAVEIKRDYNYLIKTWETVRNLTLQSTAPALVYEEGSLIRRCIRDLYSSEYEEIIVDGANAYSEAREFMKLMMPSHVKKIKQHKGTVSLYRESGVEDQLAAMFNPTVTLPSGGYLVINPTEALVSVDVNSGRSTGEYSIERTALNTNLEAADEVARQMRLRDLAGLLVIDFIDMDENRNNRAVEKRMKDALKNDRARIQVGRISPFGLLEMSRQRIRSGVIDSSSNTCQHCQGTGIIRSVESRALHVLRQLGEQITKNTKEEIHVGLPSDVAVYLLNQKRAAIVELEQANSISIIISIDPHLMAMEMTINADLGGNDKPVRMDAATAPSQGERHTKGRRERKDKNDRQLDRNNKQEAPKSEEETDKNISDDETSEETRPKRRRRGRRGGRNRRPDNNVEAPENSETPNTEPLNAQDVQNSEGANIPVEVTNTIRETVAETAPEEVEPIETSASNTESDETSTKPKRRRTPRRSAPAIAAVTAQEDTNSELKPENDQVKVQEEKPAKKPTRRRTKASEKNDTDALKDASEVQVEVTADATAKVAPDDAPTGETPAADPNKPTRRGWWRRS